MSHPTPAERTLYTDLTRLLLSSRDSSQAAVEARIEERFRGFLRANPQHGIDGLQITLTWRLPDGADDWAIYGTEYRTLEAEQAAEQCRAVAGGPAEVLAFPTPVSSLPSSPATRSAEIIRFRARSHAAS